MQRSINIRLSQEAPIDGIFVAVIESGDVPESRDVAFIVDAGFDRGGYGRGSGV
jgi:hypothetical protein